MKVAFLTEFFHPHIGGCEKRYLEIGRRLTARGHKIDVFTIQYDGSLPAEEQVDGMDVHRYAYSSSYISQDSFRSFGGILKFSSATFLRLRGAKFDVYYSNQWPMLHSLLAKPVASPLVQEWCEVWDSPVRVAFMQRLIKRAGNYNVAVSEFTKQRLISKLGFKAEKITLVPNGVDTARFATSQKKAWGRIVYAGRIVPHKHVEMLIDAFKEVKKQAPQAELHIIGSGLSLPSIRARAAGVKDCYIHGFVPEEEMIELFKSAWLFVLPSEREGSGIAAMEAMAAGVPYVTVDFPDNAAKELCSANCCVATKPRPSALASAIVKLFGDEAQWMELSANAVRVAKENDWDRVTDQMEHFLNAVVNKPGK